MEFINIILTAFAVVMIIVGPVIIWEYYKKNKNLQNVIDNNHIITHDEYDKQMTQMRKDIKQRLASETPQPVRDMLNIIQPGKIFIFDSEGKLILTFTGESNDIYERFCQSLTLRDFELPYQQRIYTISYYRPPAKAIAELSDWLVFTIYVTELDEGDYYSLPAVEDKYGLITISKEEINGTL